MEKQMTLKTEYNNLDKLLTFLKKETNLESSILYDSWDVRTDSNGQMEKCIVVKKSNMHGIKVYFTNENTLQINYIIPNKVLNAYFGNKTEKRKNIIELLTGMISQALLSSAQKKEFEEIQQVFDPIKG